MNDVRDLLERESLRHELPAGSFDRLSRKRDGRRRNQRITAGVVAFAVAAAAFTGAIGLMHGSRVSPAAHAITPQNVGHLQLQWSGLLDGSAARLSNRPYGDGPFSPVAAGDLVLVASQRGTLFAFPASCTSSCRPAWTAQVEGGVSYPPTVADGVAYVVSATGHVAAFNLKCATDGSVCKPIWTGRAGHGIYSSPVVSDGMLFGIDASWVYAFSTSCGTNGAVCVPAWTAFDGPMIPGCLADCSPPARLFKGGVVAPAVSGGVVFATDHFNGALYALDEASGRRLWFARPPVPSGVRLLIVHVPPTPSGWVDTPVVDNNTVYWTAQGQVYAYPTSCRSDGGTCSPKWKAPSGAVGQPVVSGGVVYAVDNWMGIQAYPSPCPGERLSCKALWNVPTLPLFSLTVPPLTMGPGHLIWPSPQGTRPDHPMTQVRLISIAADCSPHAGACKPQWISAPIFEKSVAPVVIVDGIAFTGTSSGSVYGYADGCDCGAVRLPAWDYTDTITRRLSTPAVAGGRVYVATGDGRLLAFGLPALPALPATPPAQPASKRGAAIFYLAAALVGAAALMTVLLRKRRRRHRSAA